MLQKKESYQDIFSKSSKFNPSMKICIAQFKSIKGDVQKNIQNHVLFIERAIELNGDLIIFPELSITGYEPCLAKELATSIDDPIFDLFQNLSDVHNLTIGIGMPIKAEDGINISLLIFQAKEKKRSYSKQILHSDELPYFVCGYQQTYLKLKNKKIALGICYETLQREHFLNAIENDTDIYIASVAKPQSGMKKAHSHFSKMANEFNTPILVSNAVGTCDNFLSFGQSAAWNKDGEILNQFNSEDQGILLYDTDSNSSEIHILKHEESTSN